MGFVKKKRQSIQAHQTRYGSFEAKTQLSRILKQVERGQHIEICRHGKVVAKVLPPEEVSEAGLGLERVESVIAGIFELQKQVALNPGNRISIQELRDTGRKG